VPPERFEAFWKTTQFAPRPGGRVFFVDSLGPETSDEKDRRSRDPQGFTTTRRLDDGRDFRIVKVLYDPAALKRRLAGLGWNVSVHTMEHLIYGFGESLA
jgi:hypothetical protein